MQILIASPSYSNAGGGGERVLWMSIAAIQRAIPDAQITVYCDSSNLESDDLCRGAEVSLLVSRLNL